MKRLLISLIITIWVAVIAWIVYKPPLEKKVTEEWDDPILPTETITKIELVENHSRTILELAILAMNFYFLMKRINGTSEK